MNFICNKFELADAIGNVSRAVPQKSTIQALEGIKVRVSPNEVELTGFNLEMGIRTTITANTQDSGEFVVSARLFSEFVRKMSGDEVTVSVDDNNMVQLSSVATECSFVAMSAEEYPDLPVVDAQRSFSVKQTILRSMINMTSYAASLNESKPVLTGELFDIEEGGLCCQDCADPLLSGENSPRAAKNSTLSFRRRHCRRSRPLSRTMKKKTA